MLIGYARVSTQQQTTDPQEDELRRAGCERIFSDVTSGAKARRPGLDEMLAQARKGDVIVVVRLDRLGRSLVHLVSTVEQLESDKIGFRSLAEKIDSTSAGGKLVLHIFACLAQFERALITERVRAGLDQRTRAGPSWWTATEGRPHTAGDGRCDAGRSVARRAGRLPSLEGLAGDRLPARKGRPSSSGAAAAGGHNAGNRADQRGQACQPPWKRAKAENQVKTTHPPTKGKRRSQKPASTSKRKT